MRARLLILALALPAGCGSDGLDSGRVATDLAVDAAASDLFAPAAGMPDLAAPADLTAGLLDPAAPDLAAGTTQTDLATGDLATPPDLRPPADLAPPPNLDCPVGVGPYTRRFVVNRFLVPSQKTDYGIDLDGDGRSDNELGALESVFADENLFDDQATSDAYVAQGDALMLLAVDSFDPNLNNDSCAQVRVYSGTPQGGGAPDFSGNGSFVAQAGPLGTLAGGLYGGTFIADSPLVLATPVTLPITLIVGDAPLALTMTAAFIRIEPPGNGQQTSGLDGALREAEVQMKMVPSLAEYWTHELADVPFTAHDQQLATIFDTGGAPSAACAGLGCQNPDGSCARANDGLVDTCEVSTCSLILQLLQPDLQLFAADGSYHPTPNGTARDSWSLGLGFTVVGAQF